MEVRSRYFSRYLTYFNRRLRRLQSQAPRALVAVVAYTAQVVCH